MAYKEILSQYNLDEPQGGPVTGRRVYIAVPDGTPGAVSDLPIVGTSLMVTPAGDTLTGVIARRKQTRYTNEGPQANIHITYSTVPSDVSQIANQNADEGDRSFSAYSETLTFPSDLAAWDAVDANGDILFPLDDDSIYKSISYVEFSIPRRELSDAAYTTLLGIIKDRAGTINNAAFEGYNTGQVMFIGPSGSTYTNTDGAKRWAVNLTFRARLLTGETSGDAAGPITQDDWLYIWRDYWIMPRDADGNYLYRKTNLSSLTA